MAIPLIALLALKAAQSAAQAFGQRQAARSIQRQGDFESELFGMNADLAERQAEDAIQRGQEAELVSRRQSRLLQGAQRTGYAIQNLDLTDGSPADVMASDQMLGELDAMTIRANAAREAWGYREQAKGYRMQGGWARDSARNQARSLRQQSWGTLLGGAAEMIALWKMAPKGVSRAPSVQPPVGWKPPTINTPNPLGG